MIDPADEPTPADKQATIEAGREEYEVDWWKQKPDSANHATRGK